MTELLLEHTESQTTPNAGVAVDVRRLISQVEGGTQFDEEWTGHAYDVCADACAALAARLGQASLGQGLAAEIEGRIGRFARSTSTSNMYLRLVITDKMPELPDYAPCQISVYDGTRSNGTDFSKVIQRATIYGTLMTSVNVTDLKAYFEGGRKRHLLVYLGTDRMGDIKALDKMLAAMPAILQAAGLDAGAIKEVLAAVQAGNMPPAAIKMLHQMMEVGQLRIVQAQAPLSRTEQATLLKLETAITAQLQSPAFLKSVPAIFVSALKAVATAPMRVASPSMRANPVADNDNKTVSPKDVATLVTTLRAMARDKTIPADQRREIAAALLDLRAGTKPVNPTPARIITAITRLDAMVKAVSTTAAALPPYITALRVPLAAVNTPGYAPASIKALIVEIRAMARDKTIPPAQRREMAAALLDLRAGTKAANPAPARAALGVARVTALLADAKTAPAITVRMAAPLREVRMAPSNTTAVASMITNIRAMARDKTIPPAQRREMAAALLELRADRKVANPAPARVTPDAARVTPPVHAFVAKAQTAQANAVPVQTGPARIAVVLNHLAPIIRAGASTPQITTQAITSALAAVTPKAMDLFKPVFTAMLDNNALPQQTRAALNHALETGKPDVMARLITDNPRILEAVPPHIVAKVLENIKPADIAPQTAPNAGEPKETLKPDTAKEKPSGPQYNADGTLKDCCKGEFGRVVAINDAIRASQDENLRNDRDAPSSQSKTAVWESKDDGSIAVRDQNGKTEVITASEVNQNIEDHKKLDADLAKARSEAAVDDKPQWSDDTSRMLDQLKEPPKGSGMRDIFTHICGPGCNHGTEGGFKAEPVPASPSGQLAVREVTVELVRVSNTPPAQPSASRAPRRSMRPA